MAGEDVKVTIGGDLTPIQRTFAQVKIQAAQAGEAAGLEFGNRTAYMAEQRVKRGMDGVLKSLATAKDPISAISGAIEGLGQSFRIAGGAFLGLGIGTFVKEQLEKAAEGADEFYGKINDIFSVSDNSSKEFTEKAIKNFEDAKAAYGKEGLLEYLIYGAGEKESLANGEAAYQQALSHVRTLRENEYREEADSQSANEEIRIQGEIEKINERYDAEISKAKDAGDSVIEIERAKAEAIEKIQVDAAKKAQEEIRALQKSQSEDPGLSEAEKIANKKKFAQEDLDRANQKVAENNAKELGAKGNLDDAQKNAEFQRRVSNNYQAGTDKVPGAGKILNDNAQQAEDDLLKAQQNLASIQSQNIRDQTTAQNALNIVKKIQLELTDKQIAAGQKEKDGLDKSIKEGIALKEEAANAGMTEAEKIAALKKKIADEETASPNNARLQTQQQQQDAKNQILKDQVKLKDLQASQATKIAEETKRRNDLSKELPKAQSDLATAQANAMGFHGQVSSLRREGFGRTPGASIQGSQLKAAQASEKHLSDIKTEISQLNAKIGGTA